MRIYLSGPMSGLPRFNHDTFELAASALRGQGHEVFSPHEKNEEDGYDFAGCDGSEDLAAMGFDLRRALALDLGWICAEAEGVVVLPGWRDSKGARAEVATAFALGLPVWSFDEFVLSGEAAPQVVRPGLLPPLYGRRT